MSEPLYNVEHADNVEHAEATVKAVEVDHADSVETVDNVERATNVANVQTMEVTQGTPLPTNKVKFLQYLRDTLGIIVVLIALALTLIVVVDKNTKESSFVRQTQANRELIQELQKQLAAGDKGDRDRLVCGRRYQDAVDAASTQAQIDVGDLIVILATNVAGPDRQALIDVNIAKLNADNLLTKAAVNAKIDYNNSGNPVPCPIPEAPITP